MPLSITHASIESFLQDLPANRKSDIEWLVEQMRNITKREPKQWGSIIGFGKLHYQYPTGHQGDMPILGLANRKQTITLYLSLNIEQYPELKALGKVTFGKSCLYIKALKDVNQLLLIKLMKKGYQESIAYPFVKVIE
jgi:hypothetical protein